MLANQRWHLPPIAVVLQFFVCQLVFVSFISAIEDITNRKLLFGVPTKIEQPSDLSSNDLFLFNEDGDVEVVP
jgi:hypothetical protein